MDSILKNGKLFGTDGIRGTPGEYPLTQGMISKIGYSVARFIAYRKGEFKGKILIGKDTRLSGDWIETIFVDALTSYGIDVVLTGTITTPGLAFFTRELKADLGIMISASHNKATDNGIKFFTHLGQKLSLQDEKWIERVIFTHLIYNYDLSNERRGEVYKLGEDILRYPAFLKSTLGEVTLDNLVVCLDCANGSTSFFAKDLFTQLNATVYSLHDTPSGEKINVGGAVDPYSLRELVLAKNADAGFAFDGDGDRLAAVTDEGTFLSANQILPLLYSHFYERRSIVGNAARTVATSHLIDYVAKKLGRRVIETPVGFKYISSLLRDGSVVIGGEESGGISFASHIPEKDGIASALVLLESVELSGVPLHTLVNEMYKEYGYIESGRLDLLIDPTTEILLEDIQFPEVIIGRKVIGTNKIDGLKILLEDGSWILLRKSGTENVVRIYAEAKY
ncbi:MAG: hypothetical protein NC904_04060, partial [Candidatus Omnitrophica bacterium]|nr:hypothetical protein [Candidatus Omnitrophota bacterium]